MLLIITINIKNKVSKDSSNNHKNNRHNNYTTTTINHTKFSNINNKTIIISMITIKIYDNNMLITGMEISFIVLFYQIIIITLIVIFNIVHLKKII